MTDPIEPRVIHASALCEECGAPITNGERDEAKEIERLRVTVEEHKALLRMAEEMAQIILPEGGVDTTDRDKMLLDNGRFYGFCSRARDILKRLGGKAPT